MRATVIRVPPDGAIVIARRTGRTGSGGVSSSWQRWRTVPSTTFISWSASGMPMQRRTLPPNGGNSYGEYSRARKRSGQNSSGCG